MSQLRNEVSDYQITSHRKKAILTGIGSSIWRAMKRGKVRAGPGLAAFLHEMIQRLRDAIRIGDSVRSWCSWASWAMQQIISQEREHRERCEQSRLQSERIQREMAEAARSWEDTPWQSWRELLPAS